VRTIWSLWEDAVAENRTNPAYLVEESGSWREISQQEAAIAVDELASGLLAIGLKKGDSFGILAQARRRAGGQ
jgi:long-subunit acyl-CoA synthetase (AMP-forming)